VLDIRVIRENADAVRTALARRGDVPHDAIDDVLDSDRRWRELTQELETLRAQQNQLSRGRRGAPSPAEREQLVALAARGRELTDQATAASQQLEQQLAALPNIPAVDAPDADTVLREVGQAGASGRDHLELAGPMIDMERGAALSGSRFAYLRGDMVLLEMALMRYAVGKLAGLGFEPVLPPVLVRERALYGTGMWPDSEEQIYQLPADELLLVGTAEVPLASLHRDEILAAEQLPLRYAGLSPCFRREAGAAGKDTRGIFRVHQFEKLEMFEFVDPAHSAEEHERILAIEESILQDLEVPYRVVAIAVDDLGASAAKKYDCEAWMPGQQRYREVTSCSNTTDFQARRLDIRMRPVGGGRPQTLHTLNGTAATWRHLIAILENAQQEDGSVVIPKVLVDAGAPAVLRAPEAA
jgi:seryl-tRNA synthetase